MSSNINLLSTRIQSLERHVHKWIVFSLNLIELWQNIQHDTRKLKLKKIRLSNQCEKSSSDELPRLVDMLFQAKNDFSHHSISSEDNKIIMSFSEEHTTIRLILCTHSAVPHSTSNTSIEQQETKEFQLLNTDVKLNEKNPVTTNRQICNVNINEIARNEDTNAFICIQPSTQITKTNSNSQPLFKLTFSNL